MVEGRGKGGVGTELGRAGTEAGGLAGMHDVGGVCGWEVGGLGGWVVGWLGGWMGGKVVGWLGAWVDGQWDLQFPGIVDQPDWVGLSKQ